MGGNRHSARRGAQRDAEHRAGAATQPMGRFTPPSTGRWVWRRIEAWAAHFCPCRRWTGLVVEVHHGGQFA